MRVIFLTGSKRIAPDVSRYYQKQYGDCLDCYKAENNRELVGWLNSKTFDKLVVFEGVIKQQFINREDRTDLEINNKYISYLVDNLAGNVQIYINPRNIIYILSEESMENKELMDRLNSFGVKSVISYMKANLKNIANEIYSLRDVANLNNIYEQPQTSNKNVNVKTEGNFDFEFGENEILEMKLQEVLAQLEHLVGLENIKEQVRELTAYLKFVKKVKAFGMDKLKLNMHMVFTGSPGTGKTTVARIMGKILYYLGYTKKDILVEVERKDLVGEYVGKTAIKTNDVIDSAMGGVLFIDEAYSLDGTNNDFGPEAIATLIKAMEDKKDEFVVIFAGYKDEMNKFLDMNPGLRSRVGYTFNFEDYSLDQLMDIFANICSDSGFNIEEDAKPGIRNILKTSMTVKNFGNGRYAANLFQKIIMKHAIRTENIDDEEILRTIVKEDIVNVEDILKGENKKKIGF